MKDLLFGWLSKTHLEQTGLDDVIAGGEIIFLCLLVFIVWIAIQEILDL